MPSKPGTNPTFLIGDEERVTFILYDHVLQRKTHEIEMKEFTLGE